jgi:protein dithiol oxidoreductase (disulfide-forming)
MTRLAALATLLVLGACAKQEPPAPPPPPPAPVAEVPPAPAASTQTETEQAAHSQESGDGATAETAPSDASLEKMADASAGPALPAGKWETPKNYSVLVPAQPTSTAPGKIEVTEVFWLACPHCYALEPFMKAWLKSKPAWVEFVRVPVIWQPMHKSHAHLYYTLDALGRQDLVAKAFETMTQQHDIMIGDGEDETFAKMQKFATNNGVSADDFAKAWNSFTVSTNMQRAAEITERYHVQGVPFVIVNGKYTTDVAQAGGEAKLIDLISDLSNAEHHH